MLVNDNKDELKNKVGEIEEDFCDDNCQFDRKFKNLDIEDETYHENNEEKEEATSPKNPDIKVVWDPENDNNPDTDYFSVLSEDDLYKGKKKS